MEDRTGPTRFSAEVIHGHVSFGALMTSGFCPVMRWLMQDGRFIQSIPDLMAGLVVELRTSGVPISRLMTVIRTLHPMVMAINIVWEEGEITTNLRPHGSDQTEGFLASPVRRIFAGEPFFRRRLLAPDCPMDFPVLSDLKARGTTDYLISSVQFSDRSLHALSWSTRAEQGFSEAMVERLLALEPILSTILELHYRAQVAQTLLQTYVGNTTGKEVLEGKIKRGDRRELDVVLLLADMRNFTSLSSILPRDTLLSRLDRFFDAGVRAILQNQGDVLKFIGDAILAVFPVAAADLAVMAAETMIQNPDQIEVGVALHRGEVTWGNIGSEARLDFTVIGTAVNGTSRMADLCKVLKEPLLFSGELAGLLHRPTRSLGSYTLRGIPTPWELYAPATPART